MHDLQTKHRDGSDFAAGVLLEAARVAARSGQHSGGELRSGGASEANAVPLTPARELGDDGDGRDDVYGASMDSFPASDPPPWMSMRIGGPPRPPAVAPVPPHSAAYESARYNPTAPRPFDNQWVAQSWPLVRITHAEVRPNGQYWSAMRPVLRAVLHLGALTPADVRVTARYRMARGQDATAEPVRLWSVATLNDANVVFESGMLGEALDDVSEFTVVVEPAKASSHDSALAGVARTITAQEA